MDKFNIEYLNALQEKQIAENNFNNADSEYIEVAIHQYNAAIARVNLIIKKIKEKKYGKESINL